MYLSEMTRREVTVALSGDGGDEMFCGYDRYRAVGIADRLDRLPRWMKGSLRPRSGSDCPARSSRNRIAAGSSGCWPSWAKPPERRYLRWINIFDDGRRRDLYTDDFAARLGRLRLVRVSAGRVCRVPESRLRHANDVRRRPDVSSLRHPDQGRHRQHGVQPGGPLSRSSTTRWPSWPPACRSS